MPAHHRSQNGAPQNPGKIQRVEFLKGLRLECGQAHLDQSKKKTGWENFRWNVRTWGGKRIESWNKKTLNLDLFYWICLRLFHPIDPFILGHLSGFQSIYVKSYSLDLFCWCFADSIPWWSSPIFHHHLVEYVFPMTKQANRRRINCWYLSLKGLGKFQVSRFSFFLIRWCFIFFRGKSRLNQDL